LIFLLPKERGWAGNARAFRKKSRYPVMREIGGYQSAAPAPEPVWNGTTKWQREGELRRQMLEFLKRRRSGPVTAFRAPLRQMAAFPAGGSDG